MSLLKRLESSLPAEFEEVVYRELHPDLQNMSSEKLRAHWNRYGRREGRRPHVLASRLEFAKLVPPDASALEIGPFHARLLEGENVKYFDIMDRSALIARATELGLAIDRIPDIDFVSPEGDLNVVEGQFDVVLSSHVLEHQPDLIRHLRAVERLLVPGGFYFLLVPDKNYCFDHFIPESLIAEVIDAHYAGHRIHTLKSQLLHAALRTHNESKRHWAGDHGELTNVKERIMEALVSYRRDPGRYVDVHAWFFNPDSFRETLSLMHHLEYVGFTVERIYPTLKNHNEFWAILKAPRH